MNIFLREICPKKKKQNFLSQTHLKLRTMSRAEKFILENTNQFSNEDGFDYIPWLSPDQARKAVEIAREEITERALIAFQVVCNRPAKLLPNCESYCNACKQFKQAIKDE